MDPNWHLMVIRILIGALFGGFIGYERENPNRPAGFRTHILVCVASALIMLTSEFLYQKYAGRTDPARLSAQVISGIGFLGAGTIIKDKFRVRGLTTAASLWSVACIGLAVGGGYYTGAAVATVVIFITLMALKKMEKRINRKTANFIIYITVDSRAEMLEEVLSQLGKQGAAIETVDFIRNNYEDNVMLKVMCKNRFGEFDQPKLISDLYTIGGVLEVTHD